MNSIIDAALRAPDHGNCLPWRVIEFPTETRSELAAIFEAEKIRRDPLATAEEVARARDHATHSPALLAFVVRPQQHPLVPPWEQWLSAGAALGSILSAAHLLGFGAIILSGERCGDRILRDAMGIRTHETLAGFISIGTIAKAPAPAARPSRARVCSIWGSRY